PLLLVVVVRVGAPEHESWTVTPTAGVPVTASAVPTRNPRACASQLRSGPGSPSATLTPGPLLIVPRTVCPWALRPAVQPVLFASPRAPLAPPLPASPRRWPPTAWVRRQPGRPAPGPGRRRAAGGPGGRAARNAREPRRGAARGRRDRLIR